MHNMSMMAIISICDVSGGLGSPGDLYSGSQHGFSLACKQLVS